MPSTSLQNLLPLMAGTGSALVGGFYIAFSVVTMPALRHRPPREAVAAMMAINEQALKPPFMALFFGTAAACGAVAVTGASQQPLGLAGAAAYLAGWALTMAINVPRNSRLLTHGPGNPDVEWNRFQRSWVPANHLRAGLSAAGAVAMLVPVSQSWP
ncbi:hypothetical protein CXX84_03370 [Arthrobacter sp. AFG7.2]|nr:hypothetical protein CXX84_03370 [Arthrobacter sp. AFG7.2]